MVSLSLLIAVHLTPQSSYRGFERTDYPLDGRGVVVVAPKVAAKGRPWIWRTEFFDHRPELDLALLNRGFHLAYLDLQDGYGSPAALARYDQFYRQVRDRFKLSSKVVLEGFSRGGLSAYNWAAMNPDKVMAIYADAPVCDFRSWPRKRPDAASDWQKLLGAYGFPTEQDALDYPFGPIGKLEVLAKAKIPIIHVVGLADDVVPVAENTTPLAQRYRQLGGLIQVIEKPGVGHHPHSLDDPTPLVEFLLKHQNRSRKSPPATVIPAPNPESRYRSAGWSSSWLQQHEAAKKSAASIRPQLLLIGDSITQGWGGPGRQSPSAAYSKHLASFNAVNMGMSGDRTQHVLWRIDNGALDTSAPQVVSLLIGVNNLSSDSPKSIVMGVDAILRRIRAKLPRAKVILNALFPVGVSATDPRRAQVAEVNLGLKRLSQTHRTLWLDLSSDLKSPDGSAHPERMAADGLHLRAAGYDVWGERLSKLVLSQLGR